MFPKGFCQFENSVTGEESTDRSLTVGIKLTGPPLGSAVNVVVKACDASFVTTNTPFTNPADTNPLLSR